MSLKTKWNGDGVTIWAVGSLDYRNSPDLREALMDAASRRVREVTVDMSSVRDIDSSVVATLSEAGRFLRERGCRLIVQDLPGILKDVFFLTSEGRRLDYLEREDLREGA